MICGDAGAEAKGYNINIIGITCRSAQNIDTVEVSGEHKEQSLAVYEL